MLTKIINYIRWQLSLIVLGVSIMNRFENKTIFFFGDSITSGGSFLTQLRGFFYEKGKHVAIFNKGIAGARADFFDYILGEELSFLKPDYAVLSYGVNDLGIWLYKSGRELSKEEQQEKENRIKIYSKSILSVVQELKKQGITPIICSPFCVNEDITEREDIITIGDNKEKEELIDNSFYKKSTFKNINNGLNRLREVARGISKNERVEFWDLYEITLQNVTTDCFSSDGIHYSDNGNQVIANGFLKCMGYSDSVQENYDNNEIKEINALEQDMRAYFFVKYNLLNIKEEKVSIEEIKERLQLFYKKNGYINGLNEIRWKGFFHFAENVKENIKKLNHMINS